MPSHRKKKKHRLPLNKGTMNQLHCACYMFFCCFSGDVGPRSPVNTLPQDVEPTESISSADMSTLSGCAQPAVKRRKPARGDEVEEAVFKSLKELEKG